MLVPVVILKLGGRQPVKSRRMLIEETPGLKMQLAAE